MDVMEKVRSTFGAYTEDDVRGLLKADHEVILSLAKSIDDAKTASSRRALVDQLAPFLKAHSKAEEMAVYVPLTNVKGSPDSHMAGNEGAVEHFLADTVLSRMVATKDASTDMWKAHAKVLFELLDHHVKEEEEQVFEELGEHFTEDQRRAMATAFLTRKAELLDPR